MNKMTSQASPASGSTPYRFWWIATAALVAIEVAVLAWLLPNESEWENARLLQLSLVELAQPQSVHDSSFRFLHQAERLMEIEDQLSFSDGICGIFAPEQMPLDSSTPTLELFYFEFEAGNPLFFDDVLGHAPEVCMKASGAELIQIHPERELPVEDQQLQVRVLEFKTPIHPAPLWVYRITWLPQGSRFEPVMDGAMMRRERIRGGLLGNPRPPARTILAGARNFENEASAWEAFQSLVGERLSLRQPIELAASET